MRANLVGLVILVIVAGAALLRAEPAKCSNCRTGMQCWAEVCGDCHCLRPGGLTQPGFCG